MFASWSRRLIALAVGVFAALLSAAPASAEETVLTATGGRGDFSYNDNCPPGEFLIGIKGGQGAWVDRVGIICAAMKPTGILSEAVTFDRAEFGGRGGGIYNKRCKPNYVIAGFNGNLTDGPKR